MSTTHTPTDVHSAFPVVASELERRTVRTSTLSGALQVRSRRRSGSSPQKGRTNSDDLHDEATESLPDRKASNGNDIRNVESAEAQNEAPHEGERPVEPDTALVNRIPAVTDRPALSRHPKSRKAPKTKSSTGKTDSKSGDTDIDDDDRANDGGLLLPRVLNYQDDPDVAYKQALDFRVLRALAVEASGDRPRERVTGPDKQAQSDDQKQAAETHSCPFQCKERDNPNSDARDCVCRQIAEWQARWTTF